MRNLLRAWRCRALGCAACDEDPYHQCLRCGIPAGADGWRDGWYWWFRRWLWEIRFSFHGRCHECDRSLWPWSRRVKDWFCSESCFENNIPF
jgi:hypothetical protein